MSFQDALDIKLDDIERPPVPPTGHMIFRVSKVPVQSEIAQGRFDTLTFQMQGVQAHEDMDPEAVASVGGPNAINLRKQFLFNKGTEEEDKANFDRSLYNLKQFLGKHLALDLDGVTMKEALEASVNAQCLGEITHRPDPNDPEIIYAEIGRTAPVE